MRATNSRARCRLVESLQRIFIAYQPLRFLIVGGFNTALCFLVYLALIWTGLYIWVANFGALLFGIGLSFLTQGRVVFRNPDPRRFGRFAAIWFIICGIQTLAIQVLIQRGIGAPLAGLIVLPATTLFSFLVQKWFVFRKMGAAK